MDEMDEALVCGGCGYSLRGLARRGRCPECGEEFETDHVLLWGKGGPDLRRRTNAKFELAWFISWVTISGGMLLAVMRLTSIPPLFLMTWCGMVLWTGYRQRQIWRGRNGWQARLTKEGFGMRPGVGKVRLTRWREEEINLYLIEVGKWGLTVRRVLRTPVALELRLSEEEAAVLRDKIQSVTGRRVWFEK